MKKSLAAFFTVALSFLAVSFAQAQRASYTIVADDGKPVANHVIPRELVGAVEKMPGVVAVGNPRGDVTIAEFYDLNCPYCRRASADIHALIKADRKLRVLLVPFPVLGIPSVLAGRVELAVAKTASPEVFYQFHRKIYEGRGVIDGQRALDVAAALKLDQKKLLALADADEITDIMKSHVRLGDALGLVATPSYVIGGLAIVGHPGRNALEAIVAAMRKCGKAVC